MEIHRFHGVHGNRKSMNAKEICGNARKFMEIQRFRGNPLIFMGILGSPWMSIEIYGDVWRSIDARESIEAYEISWKSIDSMKSVEVHGNP